MTPDVPHQYNLPEGTRYEHGGRGLIPGEPTPPPPNQGLPPAPGGPSAAVAPNPASSPTPPMASAGPAAPPAPVGASPFPSNPLETLNRKGGL